MIQNYESILKRCQNKRGEAKGQLSLYESESVILYNESNDIKLKNEVEEYSSHELIKMEKESIGVYISAHPLDKYYGFIKKYSMDMCSDVTNSEKYYNNSLVKIAGIVENIKIINTKRKEKMAFVKLSDKTGSIECVFFPEKLKKYSNILYKDNVILASGNLSVDTDKKKLLVSFSSDFDFLVNKAKDILVIKLKSKDCKEMNSVLKTLNANKGNCCVLFFFEESKSYCKNKLLSHVNLSEQLLVNLKKILGEKSVELRWQF